jgi:hypothetical protein
VNRAADTREELGEFLTVSIRTGGAEAGEGNPAAAAAAAAAAAGGWRFSG